MKASKLDEIKKELEKRIEFREGVGVLKDSFFGEYQGTSITLTYYGNFSGIWIGKIDNEHKVNLSMSLKECSVRIEASKILFRTQDCVVVIGD